jgi:hypothetical protein
MLIDEYEQGWISTGSNGSNETKLKQTLYELMVPSPL